MTAAQRGRHWVQTERTPLSFIRFKRCTVRTPLTSQFVVPPSSIEYCHTWEFVKSEREFSSVAYTARMEACYESSNLLIQLDRKKNKTKKYMDFLCNCFSFFIFFPHQYYLHLRIFMTRYPVCDYVKMNHSPCGFLLEWLPINFSELELVRKWFNLNFTYISDTLFFCFSWYKYGDKKKFLVNTQF